MSTSYIHESTYYSAQTVSMRQIGRKGFQRHAKRESKTLDSLPQQTQNMNNSTEILNALNTHDNSKPKENLWNSQLQADIKNTHLAKHGMQESDDENNSNYAVLEDYNQNRVSDLTKFGQAGTKHAAVTWFKETQMLNVKVPNQEKFAEWFHGIITRKESERLLHDKIIGCFLIRVSESRFGYSLSFKAEKRCRHYMIDQLRSGKFIIIGEPKAHNSLQDMVNYHKKVRISNWDHCLTAPCGQEVGTCDYTDLVKNDYFTLENLKLQVQSHTLAGLFSGGNRQALPPTVPSKEVKIPWQITQNVKKRPLPKLPEETTYIATNENDEH